MKRLLLSAGVLAVVSVVVVAIVIRTGPDERPWKTTDVWYHESDVAQLARTGRPQLVEFFHPD